LGKGFVCERGYERTPGNGTLLRRRDHVKFREKKRFGTEGTKGSTREGRE